MKERKKQQNGITLVALVITIIILLILAGISISALTNQGLFKQAENAKLETEIAREKEQIKMAVITELAYQSDHYTILLDGLSNWLYKYNDVDKVIGINSIPEGATIVSKSNKKFQLKDLFITTSYAAEDNEYAEVTYKSKRIYYVKLSGDKIGTIYENPNNKNTNGSNDPSNPNNPGSSSDDDMFTYEYFDAQAYFEDYIKCDDYQTLEEYKNYLIARNWEIDGEYDECSSPKCYLASQNKNGYIVTGFSTKAKEARSNGTLKNTLYIPSRYDDGNGNGEADVIALGGTLYSSGGEWDWNEDDEWTSEGNIYETVKKMYVPSTVVALGRRSLECVTVFGTEIEYSDSSNVEYIANFTFGDELTGKWTSVGQKYVKIPDSVKIFGVQGCGYWWNYYSLGNNITTLIESGISTIYDESAGWYPERSESPYRIAFFRGKVEELNNSDLFTSVNAFCDDSRWDGSKFWWDSTDFMYCLEDNKIAIQEKSGDNYIWKELTEDELKNNISKANSLQEGDDSLLQSYIDSLNVIINNAKSKFN